MKNNSIEKVFRKKLEDLRIEPSALAKDRVYSSISKQSRIRLYKRLSIAAGIMFLLSVGIYLFTSDERQEILVQGEQKIPDSGEAGNPVPIGGRTPENSNAIMKKEKPASEKNRPVYSHDTDLKERAVNGRKEPAGTADNLPDTLKVTRPLALTAAEKGKGMDKKRGDGPVDPLDFGPDDDQVIDSAGDPSVDGAEELSEAERKDVVATDMPETGTTATEPNGKDQPLRESRREPLKITIEYIASGPGTGRQNARTRPVKDIYDKVNKLVYPEAVIGDIRTFKDQLFALDFINDKTSETQNKNKK